MHYSLNWFESRVKITPNDVAVVDSKSEDTWTYAELSQRVNQLANYLKANGVQKGDRIAILAPNHISYFDFFFACMKVGAIFVPINWRLSDIELDYILNDCTPKFIGVDSSFQEKIKSMKQIKCILIDKNNYIVGLKQHSGYEPLTSLQESDALAMIYTGGTTGMPKGVVLTHRSILWNALNTIVSWNINKDDTTLTCLPMFHTGGLNVFSLPLLLIGGKVVVSPEFDPEQAVADLIKYKCTVVLFVPTMYHMMIETDAFKEADFPDMKVFVSGGAPCPQKVYEAFQKKGIAFKEGYGLTEAGPNNFYIDPKDTQKKRGSVGKPMLFNEIRIMNNKGVDVKANEVGELLVRGKHAFAYYWNKPKQTEETIKDGWIRTGDLAKQDKDGFVYIVGRKKDMIITGGENVYPLEVEHWLEAHPDIDEAAVVGLTDEKWGEVVVAFVVLKKKMTEDELREYCVQKLTRYKIPKQFYTLAALPKTHVGKVDKVKLKGKYSKHNQGTIS